MQHPSKTINSKAVFFIVFPLRQKVRRSQIDRSDSIRYLCKDMKPIPHLQYRPATPQDAGRILQIIRQAQAQMRALGSQQWQDGYPAAQDIELDIERGWGVVALHGREPSDESCLRPTQGAASGEGAPMALGHSAENVNKIAGGSFGTPNCPKNNGRSGREEKVPAIIGGKPSFPESSDRTINRTPFIETLSIGNGLSVPCSYPLSDSGLAPEPDSTKKTDPSVLAYAAVVFDGEPAYDVIEGAWIGEPPYVVVHRLVVADEVKGQGVATAFMRSVEEMARARGFSSFRIDTACDNRYMQRMLRTLGFTCCGRIQYRSGERLAYEKKLQETSSR